MTSFLMCFRWQETNLMFVLRLKKKKKQNQKKNKRITLHAKAFCSKKGLTKPQTDHTNTTTTETITLKTAKFESFAQIFHNHTSCK